MKLQLLCLITVSCVTCVLAAEQMTHANVTELIVGNRTVLNSWQSSQHDDTCFWGRSAKTEDDLSKDSARSYQYFHSKSASNASNGFHWLVLQLSASAHVTAVRILGRNDTVDAQYNPVVYNRAAGIEIWTSASEVDFTGADHCNARNLSQYFSNSLQQWKLCGVTKAGNENVIQGEVLAVNCSAEVKMLLLRRYVANLTGVSNADYMSFAGIRLTLVEPSKPFAAQAATAAALSAILLLFILVALIVKLRRKKPADTTTRAEATRSVGNQDICVYVTTDAIRDGEKELTPPTDAGRYQIVESNDPDCSYATVISAQPTDEQRAAMISYDQASLESFESQDTDYISLIGDGD